MEGNVCTYLPSVLLHLTASCNRGDTLICIFWRVDNGSDAYPTALLLHLRKQDRENTLTYKLCHFKSREITYQLLSQGKHSPLQLPTFSQAQPQSFIPESTFPCLEWWGEIWEMRGLVQSITASLCQSFLHKLVVCSSVSSLLPCPAG